MCFLILDWKNGRVFQSPVGKHLLNILIASVLIITFRLLTYVNIKNSHFTHKHIHHAHSRYYTLIQKQLKRSKRKRKKLYNHFLWKLKWVPMRKRERCENNTVFIMKSSSAWFHSGFKFYTLCVFFFFFALFSRCCCCCFFFIISLFIFYEFHSNSDEQIIVRAGKFFVVVVDENWKRLHKMSYSKVINAHQIHRNTKRKGNRCS